MHARSKTADYYNVVMSASLLQEENTVLKERLAERERLLVEHERLLAERERLLAERAELIADLERQISARLSREAVRSSLTSDSRTRPTAT